MRKKYRKQLGLLFSRALPTLPEISSPAYCTMKSPSFNGMAVNTPRPTRIMHLNAPKIHKQMKPQSIQLKLVHQ
jgi:hypothetical protein